MTTLPTQQEPNAHVYQGTWHEVLDRIDQIHRDEAWGCSTSVERARAHLVTNDLGNAPLDIEQAVEHIVLETTHLPTSRRMERTLAWFWAGVGTSLSMRGHRTQALLAFEEAINMESSYVPALYGRALMLSLLGQYSRALEAASAALVHAPEHVGALLLKTQCYVEQAQPGLAWRIAVRLQRFAPYTKGLAGMLLLIARQQAHWDALGLDGDRLSLTSGQSLKERGQRGDIAWLGEQLAQGHPVVDPDTLMMLVDDPNLHTMAASLWHEKTESVARAAQIRPLDGSTQSCIGHKASANTIKLAYVAGQSSRLSDAQLLLRALHAHNRAAFEVTLIWLDGEDDLNTLRDAVEPDLTVLMAKEWSDERIAQWCRDQGVDIAVNLQGSGTHVRWGMFAHPAAPVQVNWLGYPGSLPGVGFQYVVADAVVLKSEQRAAMHESVIYLPHTHIPFQATERVSEHQEPPTRDAMGLWGYGPVMCYLGETELITPEVWACWMRIMLSVPDALLWLCMPEFSLQETMRSHARKHSVDPARLVFLRLRDQEAMWACAPLAYLGLDTFPRHEIEHTRQLLRVGVPTISCAGKAFSARTSASLLAGLGCQELVADDLESYVKKAVQLLSDPALLMACRHNIREKASTEGAAAPSRVIQSLEAAYGQIQQQRRLGQPPSDIHILTRTEPMPD